MSTIASPTRIPAATLRHSILAARDFKIRPVEVEAWGLTVHLRSLSVLEAIHFESARAATDPSKVAALLLTFTLCDSEGVPAFGQDQVDELCGKDPDVVTMLFKVALALTTEDDVEGKAEDAPEKP